MKKYSKQRVSIKLNKLLVIRKFLVNVFYIYNSEEIFLTNTKLNSDYEKLADDIFAKLKEIISVETLVKIMFENNNLNYELKSIQLVEDYILFSPQIRNEYIKAVDEISLSDNPNYELLPNFIGEFDLFFSGGNSEIFDKVYHDELSIYDDGTAKLFNPYTFKEYTGKLYFRGHGSVQIHIYDIEYSHTFESYISLNYNNYSPLLKELYGLSLSFDANEKVCCYPVLLAPRNTYHRNHNFILSFFEKCIPNRYFPLQDETIFKLKKG